jgi:predicted acyltransferase
MAMVFVNTVGGFNNTPWWSKHSIDFGLTYVDLVAPFFIFAIGLTYHMSFIHHLRREGKLNAYVYFIRRYFALIGIGFFGSIIFTPQGVTFGWHVLQAIGLAGLITLIFIDFHQIVRLIAGLTLGIAYQIVLPIMITINGLQTTLGDLIFIDVHGGLLGGIGWAAIMIISSAITESLEKSRPIDFLKIGAGLTLIGTITHGTWLISGMVGQWGISKERVTLSYILVSIGLACLIFYFFWYLYDFRQITGGQSQFFKPMGRNPIFLYIFHGILIGVSRQFLIAESQMLLVLLSGIFNVTIVWIFGYWMYKKNIFIVI